MEMRRIGTYTMDLLAITVAAVLALPFLVILASPFLGGL